MKLTDDELRKRAQHLRGIHAKEHGLRAGEAAELMEEVLRLRAEVRFYAPMVDMSAEVLAEVSRLTIRAEFPLVLIGPSAFGSNESSALLTLLEVADRSPALFVIPGEIQTQTEVAS